MSMMSKVRIGVLYELRLYKYQPGLLLRENIMVILGFFIAVAALFFSLYTKEFEQQTFVSLLYVGLVTANSLSSAFDVFKKTHRDKKNKFRQFLIVIFHDKLKINDLR